MIGLWNGSVTSRYSSTGSNTLPPRTFSARSCAWCLCSLATSTAKEAKALRVAGEHDVVRGIDHGHGDRPAGVVHAANELVGLGRQNALHREHRRGVTVLAHQAVGAGLAGACRADECGDGENLVDLRACGFDRAGVDDGLRHMHAENALRMAEQGHRIRTGQRVAELVEVEQGAELCERDAFDAGGGIGCGAELGRVRFEGEQIGLTAGRRQQLRRNRGEQVVGGSHVVDEPLCQLWIVHELLDGHDPWRGLAGEHKGVWLRIESVHKEFRGAHTAVSHFLCGYELRMGSADVDCG